MAPDAFPLHTEEPTVSTRRVLLLVGLYLAAVVVLLGGLAIYYRGFVSGASIVMAPRAFPAPQIQPNPTQDYVTFSAAQERQREGYAWSDRGRDLVHVPIERAMALVVARGTLGYDPVPGTPPWLATAPLDGSPRAVPVQPVAPYGQNQ